MLETQANRNAWRQSEALVRIIVRSSLFEPTEVEGEDGKNKYCIEA